MDFKNVVYWNQKFPLVQKNLLKPFHGYYWGWLTQYHVVQTECPRTVSVQIRRKTVS